MNKIQQWEKEIKQLQRNLKKPDTEAKELRKKIRDRKRWIYIYKARANEKLTS